MDVENVDVDKVQGAGEMEQTIRKTVTGTWSQRLDEDSQHNTLLPALSGGTLYSNKTHQWQDDYDNVPELSWKRERI